MNTKTILGLIALIIVGGLIWYSQPENTENGSVSNTEDTAVRTVVTEFGAALKMVPLLASTEDRAKAMNEAYGKYVAPELLATWYKEGSEALGRYTSSPSPDRIEIVEIKKENEEYIVEGNVIETVMTENNERTPAAIYPVTLTLENRNGNWLITRVIKGAYSEIPHTQTIIGYWECLPHKDRSGPQTMECAFGIAVDQSDGHYAVNTALMSRYPVDFSIGTKVKVTGIVTPANQLSSIQKYDIDGIISATTIEKVE